MSSRDRLKRERLKKRREDNIREALRARDFSEEETLQMGLDLIEFSIELNRGAEIEED